MGPRHHRRGSFERAVIVHRHDEASMGPRHHRRGSEAFDALAMPTDPLQWGRDIIVADRRALGPRPHAEQALQWGRDIIVADRSLTRTRLTVNTKLQWGRDIIVADRRCTRPRFRSAARASMGPRHHRRGSSIVVKSPCKGKLGFNGAATSSSRIEQIGAQDSRDHHCFNGAATSSSRIAGVIALACLRSSLQWGRDIIVADRGGASAQVGGNPKLQWGRDIIVADRSFGAPLNLQACAASMGPRHHRRGSRACSSKGI